MFGLKTKTYQEVREFLDTVPVVDTHEHYMGAVKPVEDALKFIVSDYYFSDFMASSFGEEEALGFVQNTEVSFEERYPVFEKIYNRSKHTAYAKGMRIGLKECWGIESINRDSLMELQEKLKGRNQAHYDQLIKSYGIQASINNIYYTHTVKNIVEGREKFELKLFKQAFPLPEYHRIHSINDIKRVEGYASGIITSLDDYVEGFENYLKKSIDAGVICLKDQSAYTRSIDYANVSRSEAEEVFNKIMSRPRDVFGSDQAKPLWDWFFHYFLRLASKYELPVQIHTGHMAGIRNDVVKANAALLTSTLELHPDVKFDLFHGNWPFMDEYLFLGKNYPNVYLDLCWVQSIDPIYCVELMKRALVSVPHSKIMAFGGDTSEPEWTIGYLVQARDNVAYALADMVDSGWIGMMEARQVAADWFFNNPNNFFKLGFEPIEG